MKHPGKFAPFALGILLCLGLVISTPAAAKTQAENVTRATLDNGLRVVIVRDTLAPVVTTQIAYLAGGYETPEHFPGTAHALEHMLFRDSKGMTGAQFNKMVGKMGAESNAFTTDAHRSEWEAEKKIQPRRLWPITRVMKARDDLFAVPRKRHWRPRLPARARCSNNRPA